MDRRVLHAMPVPRILMALIIAVAGLLAFTVPAMAADDVIRVTVTNDGSPLSGVGVTISGDSGTKTGTTDDSGQASTPRPNP